MTGSACCTDTSQPSSRPPEANVTTATSSKTNLQPTKNAHPSRLPIADDEAEVSEARVTLSDMTLYVDGSWEGWSGDTIVQLTDGSVWRQDEYHYEYHYAYRPAVAVSNGKMLVKGMRKPIRVRRLT